MNITYILSREAQSPWSWALKPKLSGAGKGHLQLFLASLIKQLVSSVSPVPWGHCTGSPYIHFSFPQPRMHLPLCQPPGSPVCSYQCTLVSLRLFLQITQPDSQSLSLSAPSHQKCVVFIPLILGIGLLLFFTGTGLGAATLDM